MSEASAERVRRREILPADLPAVAELLDVGFPDRGLAYWLNALEALEARTSPQNYPQFGYVLEGESAIVGVILLIFTALGRTGQVRCNVSSWYVDPAYRLHASPLISGALRFKGVTYLNVSPAPHTWPILEAQGYERYTQGQFASLPVFSLSGFSTHVRSYDPAQDDDFLPAEEAALLKDHRARGCLTVICKRDGVITPLVFLPRDVRPVGPVVMQLAYCRDTSDFTRSAGAIGRFLARRGVAIVLSDGEGPIRGLVGRFFKDRAPKYFKGADRPRLNDLSYTEAVLFGA